MISMDFVECLIQWFISKSKMIPICIIFILFHILKGFIFPVDIKHARFCHIKIANKLQNTIYVGYMIYNISAGAPVRLLNILICDLIGYQFIPKLCLFSPNK